MTDVDPGSDLRTAPDDSEDATALDDATNKGVSSQKPAEGSDDVPAGNDGSPEE